MNTEKNVSPKFIVTLSEPHKSTERHGSVLFYFASEVFRAIEEAGGKVEFMRDESNHE